MLCPTLIMALLAYGSVRPLVIVAISLIVGITDALSMPSFQSIVPSIVRRDQIARGLALNSMQFNLSRILGLAIAGVLMTSVGAIACFTLNAASYIPFIAVALWILPQARARSRADQTFHRRHLLSDLRDIARAPVPRGALLTVLATSVLCGPIITFTPVLVSMAFHGNSSDFSATVGAFGLGGLLGATGLLTIPAEQDRRRWSSRLAVVYGLTVAVIALVPSFWAVPALIVLAGASMTVSNTAANSLLQGAANPSLLGQTVSLFMLARRGGLPLGALVTGLSTDMIGIRPALLVNGTLAVVVHLVIGRAWLRSPLAKPVTTFGTT